MYKEYTMNQLVLPLDLEVRLQENDIAFAVHDLVEQIPDEAFEPFWRTTGCPAYHPRMMMKIVLCAYTQSAFSGRKIEGLLKGVDAGALGRLLAYAAADGAAQ